MTRRILIIQGHPDPEAAHFGHALAESYAEGARQAGHQVEQISVASLHFPWLRSAAEFEDGDPPEAIVAAQQAIERADHLLFIYPLWLGDMPAILKAFLEQTLRPSFVAGEKQGMSGFDSSKLKGKSARIVVTMGMPGPFYAIFYRAHSLRSFRRNILYFCGIRPVRSTLIGMNGGDEKQRQQWLEKMAQLGREAA